MPSNVPDPSVNEPLKVTANGTEYLVTIKFLNHKGQVKTISRDFKKLQFESSYLTPFMRGRLQIDNTNEKSTFQSIAAFKTFDYNMVSSGAEIINITIEQIYNPTTNQKVTILAEQYIVQNVELGLNDEKKVLNYYFVNIDYGPLMYTKLPWSTNNYVEAAAQKNTNDKQILVSDAIKHLLVSLYQKESKPQSIIDLKNWDESSSKVEYTLKNQEPAIIGLNYLMSKYESKTHDMGILTKNRGLYQLNSLDKLIKQASTKNYTGLIRIETEDNREPYTNRIPPNRSIWNNHQPIPAHISTINIVPQASRLGSDWIIDHSVSSYNISNKQFNLFNQEGTVGKLKESINNYTSRTIAFDESHLNKPNKAVLSNFENIKNEYNYSGRLALQQKFINTSKKLTIPINGNLYLKGSNFINVELTGIPLNQEMRDISGSWFILQNTTVLRPGTFKSKIVCGKLDKEKI